MAIPGVGPVVAAGWLAATAAGAVGALTDSGVSENDAHVYAEGLRRGATLVTAKVADELAVEAEQILGQADSVNVSERRRLFEADGWTGFNAGAGEYTNDEVDSDRDRARAAKRL